MPLTMEIIDKSRNLRVAWSAYVKSKKMMNELVFVNAREPADKVYDLFFSETPTVQIKFIEKHKQFAQKAYDDLSADAFLDGKDQKTVKTNPIFGKIFEKAKKDVNKKIVKLIEEFEKSPQYDRYFESQVDGGMLAGKLNLLSNTAKDLQTAKVFLMKGKKSAAMTFVNSAIKTQATMLKKAKKPPKQNTIYMPNELVQALNQIKIIA